MPPKRLPLMATGPYMPAIHSGERNRSGRKRCAWSPELVYGLYHVADGAVRLHGPSGERTPQAPCLLLLHPHQDLAIEIPAGSTWMGLRFDVLAGERIAKRKTPGSYFHQVPTRQPPPLRVWGVEPPVLLPDAVCESGRRMLDDCIAWYWRDPIAYAQSNARLAVWLADLIAVLSGRALPAQWRVTPDDLGACRRTVAAHADQGGAVGRLAERAGLTRQHFTRRFQAKHGRTPRQFAIEERMRLAGELLRTTGQPIRAVAENCGYASLSAFIRRFQRHHGTTPAQWRRQGG